MNGSLSRIPIPHGVGLSREPLYSSTHALSWSGSASHINLLSRGTASRSGSKASLAHIGKSQQLIVDDGDDKPRPIGRVTWPLLLTAAITIFGSSFPHGWNTGVLNAPMHLITDFLNETFTARTGTVPTTNVLDILWATTVSVYLIGGCAGAFSVAWFADKLGRKKALLVCHVFGFVSAFLFGFCEMANSFEMLILARLIVGFGCGAGSGLVPMYLTEIAPVNIRGAMGVLHQFALTCGIMMSQIFGMRQILGAEGRWPYLLAMTALPCVVSLFMLPWFPDSPRYLLINKGDEKGAKAALIKFRGTDDVELDMQEMRYEVENQSLVEYWSWKDLFQSKILRMPLLILCAAACCQQLSGINVVFYYSASVFEGSGIPDDKIQYAVLGTGIINVIMTGVSVPLMEVSGRRPLLLGGMIVMVAASTVITIALNLQGILAWMSYVSIVCIIAFVIGFAIGLGSIPQFIGAELFKQGPRPKALSFAGLLNWLCNFIVGITFPSMQRGLGPYSFVVFITTVTLFLIFLWWKMPETKNKTHEEIYEMFSTSQERETEEKKHVPSQHRDSPLLTKKYINGVPVSRYSETTFIAKNGEGGKLLKHTPTA